MARASITPCPGHTSHCPDVRADRPPGASFKPRICRGKCAAPWRITRREGGPDALIVTGDNGALLLYARLDREGLMTRGGASCERRLCWGLHAT
jgi:hypothetical protein